MEAQNSRKMDTGPDQSLGCPVESALNGEALRKLLRRSRLYAASAVRQEPQIIRIQAGEKWRVRFLLPPCAPHVWFQRRVQHHCLGVKHVLCPFSRATPNQDVKCIVCEALKRLAAQTMCSQAAKILENATWRQWMTWIKIESWTDAKGEVFDEAASTCPWKFFLSPSSFLSLQKLVRSHVTDATPLSIFDPKRGIVIELERNSEREAVLLTPCESQPLYPLDSDFDFRVNNLMQRCQWPDFAISPEDLTRFANLLERRVEMLNEIERTGGEADF